MEKFLLGKLEVKEDWTQQHHWTHELIVAVVPFQDLYKIKPVSILEWFTSPSHHWGDIGRWLWGRESHCFKRVWLLIGWSAPVDDLTHEYMGNKNWAQWVIFKKETVNKDGRKQGGSARVWERNGGENVQYVVHMYKIIKEQKLIIKKI